MPNVLQCCVCGNSWGEYRMEQGPDGWYCRSCWPLRKANRAVDVRVTETCLANGLSIVRLGYGRYLRDHDHISDYVHTDGRMRRLRVDGECVEVS